MRIDPSLTEKTQRPKRRYLRRLGVGVVVALVLAVLLVAAATQWIVPALARAAIERELPEHWDGSVAIDEIDFSLRGPTHIHGIRLAGPDGRQWAHVATVTLTLRDWPGLHPVLTEVHVDRPTLTAHLDDGQLRVPYRTGEPSGPSPYVDLQRVTVGGLSVAVLNDQAEAVKLAGLDLQSDRDGQVYTVSLTRRSNQASNRLSLSGKINAETLQADLHLLFRGPLNSATLETIRAASRPSQDKQLAGLVDADLRIAGPMNHASKCSLSGTLSLHQGVLRTAEGLAIAREIDLAMSFAGHAGRVERGRVVTDAWHAACEPIELAWDPNDGTAQADISKLTVTFPDPNDYGPFWSDLAGGYRLRGLAVVSGSVALAGAMDELPPADLQADVRLARAVVPLAKPLVLENVSAESVRWENRRLDVDHLRADTCRGTADLMLEADLPRTGLAKFNGELDAKRLDVTQLAGALGIQASLARGRGSAKGEFAWEGSDLATLWARGAVFLDDTNLSGQGILAYLSRQTGLKSLTGLADSDAQAVFTLAWPVLTLRQAELANSLSALQAEPDGTINLDSRQLDIYVLAVPLKKLHSLLSAIPLVNLLPDLQKSLVRLHVKGDWNDPPRKLVRVQPLQPLAAGSIGFFRRAAAGGGELTMTLGKGIGEMFKVLTPASGASSGPADGTSE